MREIFTYGSVGGAPGNRCFYPEIQPQELDLVHILFTTRQYPTDGDVWQLIQYISTCLCPRCR